MNTRNRGQYFGLQGPGFGYSVSLCKSERLVKR